MPFLILGPEGSKYIPNGIVDVTIAGGIVVWLICIFTIYMFIRFIKNFKNYTINSMMAYVALSLAPFFLGLSSTLSSYAQGLSLDSYGQSASACIDPIPSFYLSLAPLLYGTTSTAICGIGAIILITRNIFSTDIKNT